MVSAQSTRKKWQAVNNENENRSSCWGDGRSLESDKTIPDVIREIIKGNIGVLAVNNKPEKFALNLVAGNPIGPTIVVIIMIIHPTTTPSVNCLAGHQTQPHPNPNS